MVKRSCVQVMHGADVRRRTGPMTIFITALIQRLLMLASANFRRAKTSATIQIVLKTTAAAAAAGMMTCMRPVRYVIIIKGRHRTRSLADAEIARHVYR